MTPGKPKTGPRRYIWKYPGLLTHLEQRDFPKLERTLVNSLQYIQKKPGIVTLLRILNRARGKGRGRKDTVIRRTH